METLAGFLHVGLLALWVGVPGATGKSLPIEEPALCPVTPYFCPLHEHHCQKDSDCPGEKRCCHYWCTRLCRTPLKEKPGVCPMEDLSICMELRPYQCKNDFACPGNQKCCFNKCGKSCVDPEES